MRKRISILIAIMLFAVCMNSMAEGKVWEKPYANNMSAELLTIERVVFTDTATTLFFHCKYIPKYWIKIPKKCALRSDGKDYVIRSAKGLELDKRFYMPDSGEADFSLSFTPLPNSDQPFDFVEPGKGGFVISYIRSQDYTPAQLTDTYWRNMKTGEWLIGFAGDKIIYDNKIWQAVQTAAKKDAYTFTIEREGEESHQVTVSRAKKGIRRIAVDGQKAIDCNVIKASVLDDYPEPDETSQWNKADISRIDTAYLCGWMKDMNQKNGKSNETIKIYYNSIFTTSQQHISTSTDSLGYFEIKLPIAEATPVFLSANSLSVSSVLEAGKRYFMLCDFKIGQSLVMGEDARVQNELLAHQVVSSPTIYPFYARQESTPQLTGEGYLDYIMSAYSKAKKDIEQSIHEHPTLSARFREYVQNSLRLKVGRELGQANFYSNMTNNESYRQFIEDSCMAHVQRPLTLYPDMFDVASDHCNWIDREPGTIVTVGLVSTVQYLVRKGKLTPTEEEAKALKHYNAAFSAYLTEARNATKEQRDSLSKAFEASPTAVNFTRLVERADSTDLTKARDIAGIENQMAVIRPLISDRDFCDLYAEQLVIQQINNVHEPFSKHLEAYVKTSICNPVAKEKLLAENQKYIDLKNGNRESIQKSLKTIDFGDDVHGGKQMLAEILRTLQGKMVLVDFWGTWCSPCVEALKHSQELYKSLADYDIAYVYLANSSTDEAWKNVIEENKIVGDNVYHYNLPQAQQSEIESALGISSFPSYRLFDREGNLIEAKVDARDVQSLKSLLDKLGGKRRQ